MIKRIIQIVLIVVVLSIVTGLFLKKTDNPIADKIIGSGVLLLVFVLLPLFLYYRYKDKNIEDFQFKRPDKNK